MKLNERHLMQLSAVLDAGGVTEGAALLGLTQPAVSRSLAQLEDRVGAPLFQPGRRPLRATPLGLRLAAHGRAIRAASLEASQAVEGHLRGTAGHVRVGGVPFFMDAMISRMIAAFQVREPEVGVEQTYGNAPEMIALLDGGQADVAVVPLGTGEARPGLDFQPILPARNIVAARADHPLVRARRLRAADLLAYPWVAPLPGSPLRADLQSILLVLGASELAVRYAGGSLMSVVNYMTACDALAVLPHSVVFAQRQEGRIAVVPFAIPQPDRALGLLRRADRPSNPAADRFTRHLVEEFDALRHLVKRHESAVVWGG